MIRVARGMLSLGSLPHHRPQACSPQTAPIITPKVHNGNPIKTILKASLSRVSGSGSQAVAVWSHCGPAAATAAPGPVATALPEAAREDPGPEASTRLRPPMAQAFSSAAKLKKKGKLSSADAGTMPGTGNLSHKE